MKCLSSAYCLVSKGKFSQFVDFYSIFTYFEAELDVHLLFFEICHFLMKHKLWMAQHSFMRCYI
jgi:hypothetical protein